MRAWGRDLKVRFAITQLATPSPTHVGRVSGLRTRTLSVLSATAYMSLGIWLCFLCPINGQPYQLGNRPAQRPAQWPELRSQRRAELLRSQRPAQRPAQRPSQRPAQLPGADEPLDPGESAIKQLRADPNSLLPPLKGRDSLQHGLHGHVPAAEALAEFTYRNQMMERRKNDISALLASYEAEWPCFWGEEAVGNLSAWIQRWSWRFTDGWKFVCGLRRITQPCVVYSLGSAGNMAFEAAILSARPQCRIHIFDKDSFGLKEWFPDASARDMVSFHRALIASADRPTADPPRRTLRSIMAELGHEHLDILKIE